MEMMFLKKKRGEMGMTQKELAEKLGVAKSTLEKWETGHTNPRADTLIKLSKILNCSIYELVEEKNIPLGIQPLTECEKEFAEKNHDLIIKFLRMKQLDISEYYDVVIFRYLSSVKRWFSTPSIQKYKFSTIAFSAMKSAVSHEFEKQGRQIQALSLDAPLNGRNNLTLGGTIADPCDLFSQLNI